MKQKLTNLASINTGLYIKDSPIGDTYYLRVKHFDEAGKFRTDSAINKEIQMEDRLKRHLLQEGDLLLIAKGWSNKVCYYNEKIGPAVASSTFFVIRLHDTTTILPSYLQWYLNTKKMQARLAHFARGTQIMSISKKTLLQIKIDIPSIVQQESILQIQKLWDLEQKITLKLLEQKSMFYEQMMHEQIQS